MGYIPNWSAPHSYRCGLGVGTGGPVDFKDQLKASVSIVRVVGDYVKLRRASPGRYAGLCPFHTEKTGSFSVSED